MIQPEYVSRMAAYNAWQNKSIYDAADGLPDEERRRNQGAFFGSIHATLSHIAWADMAWMSRLAQTPKPPTFSIAESTKLFDDWEALKSERFRFDGVISKWATGIVEADLAGDLIWIHAVTGNETRRPRALCVVHMFNHQTHHRGQVHAMLTAAGSHPDDTDLPFMTTA